MTPFMKITAAAVLLAGQTVEAFNGAIDYGLYLHYCFDDQTEGDTTLNDCTGRSSGNEDQANWNISFPAGPIKGKALHLNSPIASDPNWATSAYSRFRGPVISNSAFPTFFELDFSFKALSNAFVGNGWQPIVSFINPTQVNTDVEQYALLAQNQSHALDLRLPGSLSYHGVVVKTLLPNIFDQKWHNIKVKVGSPCGASSSMSVTVDDAVLYYNADVTGLDTYLCDRRLWFNMRFFVDGAYGSSKLDMLLDEVKLYNADPTGPHISLASSDPTTTIVSYKGQYADQSTASVPTNIARNGEAFATDGGSNPSFIIDGLFGNPNSWLPSNTDAAPLVGVKFQSATIVTGFSFSRDALGSQEDRSKGAYRVYLTRTVEVASALQYLSNGADWDSGWVEVASFTYSSEEDGFLASKHHAFSFSKGVLATAIKIEMDTVDNGGLGWIAIDELVVDSISTSTDPFTRMHTNLTTGDISSSTFFDRRYKSLVRTSFPEPVLTTDLAIAPCDGAADQPSYYWNLAFSSGTSMFNNNGYFNFLFTVDFKKYGIKLKPHKLRFEYTVGMVGGNEFSWTQPFFADDGYAKVVKQDGYARQEYQVLLQLPYTLPLYNTDFTYGVSLGSVAESKHYLRVKTVYNGKVGIWRDCINFENFQLP